MGTSRSIVLAISSTMLEGLIVGDEIIAASHFAISEAYCGPLR